MTIERPTPPVAASVDSFLPQSAMGGRQDGNLTSESAKPAQGPSRRNVLASLAVLSAGLPASAAAIAEPDPIFAAIEGHRKAYAAMETAFAEIKKVETIADKEVGPSHLEVPSMVDPGNIVRAACWWDIERAIPSKEYPDLYEHHRALLEERTAAREAIIAPVIGDVDEYSDPACDEEADALHKFAETVPTTIEGLLAMVVYADEITDNNADAFDRSSPVFGNMATAAKALVKAVRP